MSHIADELPSILVQASEAQLRETGFCPRPQVHILAEDMEKPYVGYVTCRYFYRGADAAEAIADLGLMPSVLAATRLIVLWEDCDLRTALEMRGESFATGLVVMDAQLDRHTLHWYPFSVEVGGESSFGIPTVIPRWGAPARFENAELLAPVTTLLRTWRELRRDDIQQTAIELQKNGYELHWATGN